MTVHAVVKTLNGGYSMDKVQVDEAGFKVGDRFEVRHISMGQSNTSIYLKDWERPFNSVFFDFEEDGEELDIYSDERFNPYI